MCSKAANPAYHRPSDRLVSAVGSWAENDLARYQAMATGSGACCFLTSAANHTERVAMAKGAEYGAAVARVSDTWVELHSDPTRLEASTTISFPFNYGPWSPVGRKM
jgi:hypothetical protein